MKGFLSALEFLTIIRASKGFDITGKDLARSMAYFPVVGLFLGCILVFLNVTLLHILPGSVVDGLLIAALIVCTGALHLDGLTDTVDGLAGGNTKQEILKIMRDSSTGAIGAVGLTMLLLLKYVSLMNIPEDVKNYVLIAMPVISRFSMVQVSFFSHYARTGPGVGSSFASDAGKREFLSAASTALFLSFVLLGVKGIITLTIIGISTAGLTRLYEKKIGGTTGDTFGATNEINEVLVLLVMLALLNTG